MSWNYRITRESLEDGEVEYTLREVYYDEDGNPNAVTQEPVTPHADDMVTLMTMMIDAIVKPVLDFDTLEEL